LLGTELDSPVITPDALRMNFTNEGGVNGTTRLLKNVMGLWMLQGCRQSWTAQGQSYDYRELIELASRGTPFRHLFDPDDESFLRPKICSLQSTGSVSGLTSQFRRKLERTCEPFWKASPSSTVLFSAIWNT